MDHFSRGESVALSRRDERVIWRGMSETAAGVANWLFRIDGVIVV